MSERGVLLLSGDALSFSDQFNILGQRVRIRSSNRAVARLLSTNFGAFAATEGNSHADLDYTITGTQPFNVRRAGRAPSPMRPTPGDLLYEVEKDIVVELQRRNPQLFFLHSGAIAWQGRASLFVAESGGGKSTTTWAMLHHGYGYLSDEIAPIALDELASASIPARALPEAPAAVLSVAGGNDAARSDYARACSGASRAGGQ